MSKKKFREDLKLKKVILKQMVNYEMMLRAKKLKPATIDRKMSDLQQFYIKLYIMRENKYHTTYYNISNILFNYIRDGNFSDDNLENCGTYGYRVSIYNNIKDGMNYIYEKLFKEKDCIINNLTDEQKEILNEISKNKWFKCTQHEDDIESIQTELIKQLGIKVYFDNDNKAYTLSHELADLINKNNKDIMRAFRKIKDEIDKRKLTLISKTTDFRMIDSTYIDTMNREQDDLIIYKDLLFKYLLGLNLQGKNKDITLKFQISYIDAFNFITEEHDRLLEENAELKRTFLKMYNDMRIENRDLLLKKER